MAARRRRRFLALPVSLILLIAILGGVYFTLDYLGYSIDELFNPTPAEPLPDQIKVHVVDVGQGDGIIVETPEGCVLIDTGIDESEAHLEVYLYSIGITEIDYLVITHAHTDHYGGADMILKEFKVENILYDNYGYDGYNAQKLLTQCVDSGANMIDVEMGYTFSLGEAKFTVLSADFATATNTNDYSIVIRLDYGESSFLFTGDATKATEKYMMDNWSADQLDCDFLKSGHHGSYTSSGAEFLSVVTPDMVAISCGRGNSYGHPHKEVMERYEGLDLGIHRTDLSGDLIFVSDGATITYTGSMADSGK